MSRCQVTLSVNAGAVLRFGRTRLWVDALHNHQVPGFSTVTPDRWAAISAHPDFAEPNLIFYTHCHPDHFSRPLTLQALRRWPYAEVILPDPVFEHQILLSRPREQMFLPNLSLRFARLPHEGAQYAHVAHYGCVLEHDGFRALLTGDCAVGAPKLADFLAEVGHIDLALLDFPWVTLRKGRQFIEQYIRPEHLVICHLPFAEDDCYNYRPAVLRAAAQVHVPDIRILMEPFQREIFE